MTIPDTIGKSPLTPEERRQIKELRLLTRESKALLALEDEHVQRLAVALGKRALVLVPYSVHGFPCGNYHRDADWGMRCGKTNRNTKVRQVSEHDASKLLERCKFCRW